MIADLKPYPAMKDSGMPWLGEVPERWSLLPNKVMLRRRKTLVGERHTDYQLLSLTKIGVIVRDVSTSRGKFSADMGTFQEVRCGDLVFCLFDVPETPRTIGLSQHKGMITGAYDVFECDDHVLARYLEAFYIAMDDRKLLSPLYLGLRNTIHISKFLGVKTPVPPLPEQAAIVRFLDHADRRIRRYIRAKQQLIALLEEQKQAVIHRAVTRGLDPNVRLKPSGVEWLGDVPEHWTLKRFKFLAQVTSGQVDPRRPEYRGKILVAPNHIRSSTGEIVHLETAEDQGADSGKYEVRRGQVIYSKIRPNLRKAAIAPLDCLCSADMYPITVREAELRPAYLLLLLLSPPFTKYAVDCSLRVAMPKVNRDALGGCWIWYPNLKEQDSLLEFIKSVGGPSDLAVAQAAREVSLLREYRTRLIADVVTGKLDVREAAAGLPDEVEELEPLDEADALIGGEEEPTDALATAP